MRRFAWSCVLLAACAAAACELEEGRCLRMSDCDVGLTCVEGECLSSEPPETSRSSTPTDGAAPDARPPARRPGADASADASTDASLDAGADALADSEPDGAPAP